MLAFDSDQTNPDYGFPAGDWNVRAAVDKVEVQISRPAYRPCTISHAQWTEAKSFRFRIPDIRSSQGSGVGLPPQPLSKAVICVAETFTSTLYG